MKVLVYFSFVMLLILLFVRCRSSEEIVKFKPYKAKDYITKEIKVYEVKECLYPFYYNENRRLSYVSRIKK